MFEWPSKNEVTDSLQIFQGSGSQPLVFQALFFRLQICLALLPMLTLQQVSLEELFDWEKLFKIIWDLLHYSVPELARIRWSGLFQLDKNLFLTLKNPNQVETNRIIWILLLNNSQIILNLGHFTCIWLRFEFSN